MSKPPFDTLIKVLLTAALTLITVLFMQLIFEIGALKMRVEVLTHQCPKPIQKTEQ